MTTTQKKSDDDIIYCPPLSNKTLKILQHLTDYFQYQKIRLFNSTEEINSMFEHFKTSDWFDTIRYLLIKNYPDNKQINRVREDDQIRGSRCWMNPKYKEKLVDDVINITFTHLYPNIICKLYQKGDLKFNNDRIGDLFTDIMEIKYEEIIPFINFAKGGCSIAEFLYSMDNSRKNDDDNIHNLKLYIWTYLRIIKNMFYGILANKHVVELNKMSKEQYFICNDINLVSQYAINFWDILIKKFEDNICYIDTDEIFLRLDDYFNVNKLYNIFDLTELPYIKNNIRRNVTKSLFEEINSKRLDDTSQSKIINMVRSEIINNIFKDDPKEKNTFIGYFLEKKKYMIFNNDMELIRTCGIKFYKFKGELSGISIKLNHGYKNIKN